MEIQEPSLIRKNPFGMRGNYFLANTDTQNSKTPIVFIHGLHSYAKRWFGSTHHYGQNDMYQLATLHGHPTAFVDLSINKYGIWENGQLLAKQLEEIHERFGQKQMAIVAHSKGGIDAQAAIFQFGASSYVKSLTTLGSPHQGTPLADLAFSSKARALAKMAGFNDKGTFQMQTGYMEKFRSEMDPKVQNSSIPHFTLLGMDSALEMDSFLNMGGKFLNQYGENDGVVLAKRGMLSYSKPIIGRWNHDNIRLGRATFPILEELIESAPPKNKHLQNNPAEYNTIIPSILHGGHTYLRPEEIELPIPIQENEFWIQVLSSSERIKPLLISPSGKREEFEYKGFATEIPFFPSTHRFYIEIPHPKPGNWRIEIKGTGGAAYFIISSLSSLKEEAIQLKKTDLCQSLTSIHAQVKIPEYWNPETFKIKAIADHPTRNKTQMIEINKIKKASRGEVLAELKVPRKQLIHNITFQLSGETKSGTVLQRDYVSSFYE